jgi:hypothetical protein
MALIGWARVSTDEQKPVRRPDPLCAAGMDHVVADRRPGTQQARQRLECPGRRFGWERAAGDVDRLGRFLTHRTDPVNELRTRRSSFRSLTAAIDTSTADGELGQAFPSGQIQHACLLIESGKSPAAVARSRTMSYRALASVSSKPVPCALPIAEQANPVLVRIS